jgi:hypothetical protein
MKSGSGEDAEGEECLVRLVENKSGSRVEWVLEMTGAERVAAESGPLECTPKVRQAIKGPATLNGGEQCWCPDKSIPVN